MQRLDNVRVIEIAWSGPHTEAEVAQLDSAVDRGVVQVYATHPVFGPDALVYVDEAREAPFASGLARIEHWLRFLGSEPRFYVGRFGGEKPVADEVWHGLIADAYALLVYTHAPPWNSRGVNSHAIVEPTVVVNVGRRHRMMTEVSNLWDRSRWDPRDTAWRPFGSPTEPTPAPDAEPSE